MTAKNEVRVWDPLVRIFHWGLVLAFTVAYFTEDDALAVHIAAGYTILGLIGFRLVWGMIGPRHARFSDFVRGPRAAWAYLRDMVRGRAPRYLGHNPAGGMVIVLMLGLLILTSVTGVALYGVEEAAGPLAGLYPGAGVWSEDVLEEAHEVLANLTVLVVLFHIAGVVAGSLVHRENLVRAMITGRKPV